MATKVFSTILKKYRERSGLSQIRIAQILGVKQATISRIEKGDLAPSSELVERIKKLPLDKFELKPLEKETIKITPKIETTTHGAFSISHVSISPGSQSGDFCSVDKLSRVKGSFMLVDAVGHDAEASKMAFAIEFAYATILSVLNRHLVNSQIIEAAIKGAIGKTKTAWIGNPSIICGTINAENSVIELSNFGQPTPLFFSKGESRDITFQRLGNAIADDGIMLGTESAHQQIGPGDALLMYTDGFLELSNTVFEQNLHSRFAKAAKLLKGDSEAILKNLLNFSDLNQLDTQKFSDDATALLIARKRD